MRYSTNSRYWSRRDSAWLEVKGATSLDGSLAIKLCQHEGAGFGDSTSPSIAICSFVFRISRRMLVPERCTPTTTNRRTWDEDRGPSSNVSLLTADRYAGDGSTTTTLPAPCWIALKTCCRGNRH